MVSLWCHIGVVPDTTPTPQLAEVRVTLRIPSILAAKVGKAVGERRKEWRKYSMNDWLCEAIREKLDGPSIPVVDVPYNAPVERRAVPNIPGVQRGGQVFGRSTSEIPQKTVPVAEMTPEEAHLEEVREWVKIIQDHQRRYELDPGDALESWATLAVEHGISGKLAAFSPCKNSAEYNKRAEQIVGVLNEAF